MKAKFNVLVVNPDQRTMTSLAKALRDHSDLRAHYATTASDALAIAKRHFLHLAQVSINVAERKALENFLSSLRDEAPSCYTVLEILGFAERSESRFATAVGALNPLDKLADALYLARLGREHPILAHLEAWRSTALDVPGLDEVVAEMLDKKKSTRLRLGGRSNNMAIADEISYLMSMIFRGSVPLTPDAERAELHFVNKRRGLSPSVAIEVVPQVGITDNHEKVFGNHCWVKLGSVHATRNEAHRYETTVKFGVQPNVRVDMLGVAYGDRLGAICYSVAGDDDDGVPSLDDFVIDGILADPGVEDIPDEVLGAPIAAIEALFGKSTSRWYSLTAAPRSMKDYSEDVVHFTLDRRLQKASEALSDLATQVDASWDGTHGRFERGDVLFRVPTDETLASWIFHEGVTQCLVHGDLHGGNIMVADGQPAGGPHAYRFSLIDFANTGYAPRCLDAALLGGSIRIWDGRCYEELKPSTNELWSWADRRRSGELNHLRLSAESDASAWLVLAQRLDALLPDSFPAHEEPLNPWEPFAAYLFHAHRMLTLPLSPAQLLRIVAWLSALVEQLDTIASE